jgi:hypothetical protein
LELEILVLAEYPEVVKAEFPVFKIPLKYNIRLNTFRPLSSVPEEMKVP